MALTSNDLAYDSSLLNFTVPFEQSKFALLRPLQTDDVAVLTKFLTSLSLTTQKFYTLDTFDEATAAELCADINKYDKIRFIALIEDEMVGLFEFSMDLVNADVERYLSYGIHLQQGIDCRFGPCIADKLQGTGFASKFFPYIVTIAKALGQKRMILWGGVFVNNEKAIKFYTRNGFKQVGRFKNQDNVDCIDMIYEIA